MFWAEINAVEKNPKSKTGMDNEENVALSAYGILDFRGFFGYWVLGSR